jgi:hypothetical protein
MSRQARRQRVKIATLSVKFKDMTNRLNTSDKAVSSLKKDVQDLKMKLRTTELALRESENALGVAKEKNILLSKRMADCRYMSNKKTKRHFGSRKIISAQDKMLRKIASQVDSKMKSEIAKLFAKMDDDFGTSLLDEISSDDEAIETSYEKAERLRRKRIQFLQHKAAGKVAREAIRNMLKIVDDPEITANGLEMEWKRCRDNVKAKYNLHFKEIKVKDKHDVERTAIWIEDLDNYLRQILDREGIPESADRDKRITLRLGGDGRSIYRNSNNVLIILALMDELNSKKSHLANSVHTLMLIDGGESHELLLTGLQVIDEWIRKLTIGPEHAVNNDESSGFVYKVSLSCTLNMIYPITHLNGFCFRTFVTMLSSS